MNRRETTIALLALGLVPFTAKGQEPRKIARIGWMGFNSPKDATYYLEAFKQGMRDLGYVDGKSMLIDARWAMGNVERLPSLAKEIVALSPDVIVAPSGPTALAAQKATPTIPIVFATVSDPVGRGLVKSLARPGGNITGLASLSADTSPKLLELTLTLIPKLSRVAILTSRITPRADLTNLQAAAQKVGLDGLAIEAETIAEIESAFARMAKERAPVVLVLASSTFSGQTTRHHIAELAIKNRLPSVFTAGIFADAGGLLSYGADYAAQIRHSATLVAKILKGARPGDLPVEQATTLELVVNMKTARAIEIPIPKELLVRADRVIE